MMLAQSRRTIDAQLKTIMNRYLTDEGVGRFYGPHLED